MSRIMTAAHLESHSGSRTDYLARGGSSISRDYLSRGGTQTLGGSVKVENVTALRSTPQWLTATTSSLASTPSVGITVKSPSTLKCHVLFHLSHSDVHYWANVSQLFYYEIFTSSSPVRNPDWKTKKVIKNNLMWKQASKTLSKNI